jgi:UDP-N-acetylglucosamine 2-epimerase (non-hydrolysing)
MTKMNLLVCFGTRPEAIKMAPVYFELKKQNIPVKVCVTAQHREMLDQVLSFFEIEPDFDLNLMQPNQTLNGLSANILSNIDKVFNNAKPNLVLVHGDTTTSTVVALAAFHKGIKVGHIEAGLRTYDKKSPFPEELNRQLTSRIADYHFAPTEKAFENLKKEGILDVNSVITGNTVIDALNMTLEKVKTNFNSETVTSLKSKIDFNKKIVLVTGHRRESFGDGFENLCTSLLEIAKRTDVEIVYPVHLNPNVQNTVFNRLSTTKNIHLLTPLDYPHFVWLMSQSNLIISDSGGIQEEAPTLKIPVLVTRETTERAEGVDEGFSFLVGTDSGKIIHKAIELLDTPLNFMNKENPYGNSNASKKIVDFLKLKIT